MPFSILEAQDFHESPFSLLERGMLITVRDGARINTMTVGWGGLGRIWGKNAVYATVRPERHSFSLLEKADSFSFSALPPGREMDDLISYLGRVSGRDEDKIQKSGLTLAFEEGVPYFEEADTVFICRTMAVPRLREEDFLPGMRIMEDWYDGGLHHVFIGEILKILKAGSK